MKKQNEAGFSLIELLLVVVIIGVIAALSVHYFYRAKIAAENNTAVTTLSVMRQNEVIHFTQRQRYGRLDELQAIHGSLGEVQGDLTLMRGPFKFDLTTSTGTPTNADPKNLVGDFLITAARSDVGPIPHVYTLDQSGTIVKVLPVAGNLGE
jgi:prepilin-type N-terminal cleavage/methylation domain-containing protein